MSPRIIATAVWHQSLPRTVVAFFRNSPLIYSASVGKKTGLSESPGGRSGKSAPARFTRTQSRTSSRGTPRQSLGYERFPTAFAIRTSSFARPTCSLATFRSAEESRSHDCCLSLPIDSMCQRTVAWANPDSDALTLRAGRPDCLRLSRWLGPAFRLCSAGRSTVPERAVTLTARAVRCGLNARWSRWDARPATESAGAACGRLPPPLDAPAVNGSRTLAALGFGPRCGPIGALPNQHLRRHVT